MSRPSRAVSVAVLTCVLVLTGCTTGGGGTGAGTSAAGSATAAAPAPGATTSLVSNLSTATGTTLGTSSVPTDTATGAGATGDAVPGASQGFTVVPPEGWAEATERANGVADIDLVLLSSRKVGGFANNLVVLSTPGTAQTLSDEMDRGRDQMRARGRPLSGAPAQLLDGETATGFTTTFEQQGLSVVARSYGIVHAGRVYLLTLSSSAQDAEHAMAELGEIASTWNWTA
jgi:hypothetical protein